MVVTVMNCFGSLEMPNFLTRNVSLFKQRNKFAANISKSSNKASPKAPKNVNQANMTLQTLLCTNLFVGTECNHELFQEGKINTTE